MVLHYTETVLIVLHLCQWKVYCTYTRIDADEQTLRPPLRKIRGRQKGVGDLRDPQGLGVGSEAGEADVELGVDLEDPPEVGGDGLELHAEATVAGDGEAVLGSHQGRG
jgi:hypothetical protein